MHLLFYPLAFLHSLERNEMFFDKKKKKKKKWNINVSSCCLLMTSIFRKQMLPSFTLVQFWKRTMSVK